MTSTPGRCSTFSRKNTDQANLQSERFICVLSVQMPIQVSGNVKEPKFYELES